MEMGGVRSGGRKRVREGAVAVAVGCVCVRL